MSSSNQVKLRTDYQRPHYTITDLELVFDLSDTNTLVTATSKVVCQGEAGTLTLDGDELELKSIKLNGTDWTDYQFVEAGMTLNNVPEEFTLTIVTQINPEENTALEGLYKSGGAFCTQCEAEGFRRITYYLDRPDVLARYTTTVIADKAKYPYLLSNGNRVAEGDLENGRHFVKWQDPHPKPAYLFALVAGDFDVLHDNYTTTSGRDVKLEIFVDRGNLNRADFAMKSLINSMKWDEERFGLEYDLDIYMIVAVDFFNMGAMENKGLNVFNSKFVLANDETATDSDYLGIEAVIGHEYFHNWSGNRVTCQDWFQLSLKEGLTVFRDQEFSSDLGSRVVNRINNVRVIRGPQFAEDSSPMSHPIRPDKVIEMNNFYTLTVYRKGSEVIRMLHTLLGEKKFQEGMKCYFSRRDGTATTCDDFINDMQDATGIDLEQFKLWYSQSGTPILKVTDNYDENDQVYTLTVEQETPPTADQAEKLPLHIPLDIELYKSDGSVIDLLCHGKRVHNVLEVNKAKQTYLFEQVSEKPVVSLLRDFSAPVRLDYDYSDSELILLMVNATSEFARWDASQTLIGKYLRSNIENYQQGRECQLPDSLFEALRGILLDSNLEPAFIAEVMTLPSANEISGWYRPIDVDAIDTVLASVQKLIAQNLSSDLEVIYNQLAQQHYRVEHDAIGRRSLRNVCLQYLALLEEGNSRVQGQYQAANNMTDTVAALKAASFARLSCFETMMRDFSAKWQHDGLVMDKWFTLIGTQRSDDALTSIKAAMSHPAFSMRNPNRVRALIGSFINNNPVSFHATNGTGYAFLREIIVQLNDTNPQVASRMLDPFLKYKNYDQGRANLIKQELETLAGMESLAPDVYEKITKALESQ